MLNSLMVVPRYDDCLVFPDQVPLALYLLNEGLAANSPLRISFPFASNFAIRILSLPASSHTLYFPRIKLTGPLTPYKRASRPCSSVFGSPAPLPLGERIEVRGVRAH